MSEAPRPSGEKIIEWLEAGELPQMVDWFDPLVLGQVAVRTLISSTIGEYADQRPMQEAADGQRDMTRLTRRHDYSKIDETKTPHVIRPPDAEPCNPYFIKEGSDEFKEATPDDQRLFKSRRNRTLPLDDDGALWVDFIADLGDGFEATYAMAYLLAQPQIVVPGANRKAARQDAAGRPDPHFRRRSRLPQRHRGRVPDALSGAVRLGVSLHTRPRKRRQARTETGPVLHRRQPRLVRWAGRLLQPVLLRDVRHRRLALQAAAQLFRAPAPLQLVDLGRGRRARRQPRRRPAPLLRGHRRQASKPGDKIIIVLHAPDWFKRRYKALTMICQLAREKGEVCALLAGDLHHYSRYESDHREPKLHLITSGGGGAFAHPTHDQKATIRVRESVAGVDAPRTWTRRDLARRTALPGAPVGSARGHATPTS